MREGDEREMGGQREGDGREMGGRRKRDERNVYDLYFQGQTKIFTLLLSLNSHWTYKHHLCLQDDKRPLKYCHIIVHGLYLDFQS